MPDVMTLLTLIAVLAGGMALGFVHFTSLHRITDDYLGGHPGRALAFQLTRIVVMVAALVFLARLGALYLLAGAAGVMIARFIVMHRARREP